MLKPSNTFLSWLPTDDEEFLVKIKLQKTIQMLFLIVLKIYFIRKIL